MVKRLFTPCPSHGPHLSNGVGTALRQIEMLIYGHVDVPVTAGGRLPRFFEIVCVVNTEYGNGGTLL